MPNSQHTGQGDVARIINYVNRIIEGLGEDELCNKSHEVKCYGKFASS